MAPVLGRGGLSSSSRDDLHAIAARGTTAAVIMIFDRDVQRAHIDHTSSTAEVSQRRDGIARSA